MIIASPRNYLRYSAIFFIGIFCMLLVLLWYYPQKTVQHTLSDDQIIQMIEGYPMHPILNRCKEEHGYSDEDVALLEKELKRYFILTALKKEGGEGMYSRDVDNLWHAFILFTREYDDFCSRCVGRFIYHIPNLDKARSPEKMQEIRDDFQAFIRNYEETFGEEVHSIWFLDMCEQQNDVA